MAKSTFNLDNFKAEVLNRGLARNNRFEVLLTPPAGLINGIEEAKLVSLLAESTNFPPINVGVTSQRIFGPSYQRPKFIEFGGDNIVINFLVDKDMIVKTFFEDWIELIVEPNTYVVGYQDEYIVDFQINQLDEADNILYTVDIFDAFPRSVNIMDLSNNNTNNFHRLAVSFAYRYWSSKGRSDKKNPTIVPQARFREQYDSWKSKQNKPTNWKDNVIVPTEGSSTTTEYPGQ